MSAGKSTEAASPCLPRITRTQTKQSAFYFFFSFPQISAFARGRGGNRIERKRKKKRTNCQLFSFSSSPLSTRSFSHAGNLCSPSSILTSQPFVICSFIHPERSNKVCSYFFLIILTDGTKTEIKENVTIDTPVCNQLTFKRE